MRDNAKFRFQGFLFIGCQTCAGIGQGNRLFTSKRGYCRFDLIGREISLGCKYLERKCTCDGLRFTRLPPCKMQRDGVSCIGNFRLMGLPKRVLHDCGVIFPASAFSVGGTRGLMSEYGAAFRPSRTPRYRSRFLLSRK